ncbi:MAG: divalent metal cation transporter [bacterium]
MSVESPHQNSRIKRFFKKLGPGLVTGAADDDPSGITTYSQSGAQFGFAQLWSALYQLPLLIAVQEACARIGAVTGKGLSGVIKDNYTKKVLMGVVSLVVVANMINIGADIGAVASAIQLIINVPFAFIAILVSLIIVLLEVHISYKKYVNILKWLALALLAYPVTAIMISAPWGEIFRATIFPEIHFSFEYFFIITAVFGTTITPYMFFWGSSTQVEEENYKHIKKDENNRPIVSRHFLSNMRLDNTMGMIASQVAQWFIIIVTASVLFRGGIHNIATASDAAKALEPLMTSLGAPGGLAKVIFAIGIVGLGMLAIPVLAGSSGYALAEAFGWKEGLSKKFGHAKSFYTVIILSTLLGLLFNFIGIDPIKALVYAAVFNGTAAVPLIFLIAKINSNKSILGEHSGSVMSRFFIWLTFIIMLSSVIGLLYTFL